MRYTKVFDPQAPGAVGETGADASSGRQDDQVYLFDEDTVLAVNVALVTRRPLLVLGPPGSGKSTLAPNVARVLRYRFYAEVVTARTEAPDLLWREEAFRQLNDASRGKLGSPGDQPYHRPGPLWKALDPAQDDAAPDGLRDRPAVVLIDEIDKADPDLPNALLDPLDNLRFEGPDRSRVTVRPEIGPPLVVITSNEERELSAAFRRRCIPLRLQVPGRAHLLEVARLHMGSDFDPELGAEVADLFLAQGSGTGRLAAASTAEYLDTLRACHEMGLTADSELWRSVARFAMVKDTYEPTAYA
ncbi:MoxR family ATPase [Streptomyces sp. PA03-6a]|nr:MoxR family ATPase [Streptomyces sp. PA03-6a]